MLGGATLPTLEQTLQEKEYAFDYGLEFLSLWLFPKHASLEETLVGFDSGCHRELVFQDRWNKEDEDFACQTPFIAATRQEGWTTESASLTTTSEMWLVGCRNLYRSYCGCVVTIKDSRKPQPPNDGKLPSAVLAEWPREITIGTILNSKLEITENA